MSDPLAISPCMCFDYDSTTTTTDCLDYSLAFNSPPSYYYGSGPKGVEGLEFESLESLEMMDSLEFIDRFSLYLCFFTSYL